MKSFYQYALQVNPFNSFEIVTDSNIRMAITTYPENYIKQLAKEMRQVLVEFRLENRTKVLLSTIKQIHKLLNKFCYFFFVYSGLNEVASENFKDYEILEIEAPKIQVAVNLETGSEKNVSLIKAKKRSRPQKKQPVKRVRFSNIIESKEASEVSSVWKNVYKASHQ